MPTPDELRADLDAGRQAFRAALESVTANWEKEPESGEGEDAWSARKVAEHAIPTEVYFAKAICDACGYPGPETKRLELPTPQDALAAFDEAVEVSHGRIKYVTEEDLAKSHERFGSVEQLLALAAYHLQDHAAQIRTAAG